LKHDPNLGGQTKVRTLKWSSASKPTPPEEMPQWILAFFEYVSQLSGVLLWALGAIAVAVAAVWGYRNLRMQWPRVQMADSEPATGRILDLDISPDSLPGDVGAAALALSSDGRIREALSLLYRPVFDRARGARRRARFAR
jgi:hypothetical protein